MAPVQLIVFTDMDGSLLDHYTYSHAAADNLLNRLENRRIPVAPVTSKTRAEVEQLRRQLNNTHPFIVENGAAVYIPGDYFKSCEDADERNGYLVKAFVERRAHWQSLLAGVKAPLNQAYISFAQAGADGIMAMTGLSRQQAQLAAQREYSEPLKWRGSAQEYAAFSRYLRALGGHLLKGGRFVHVSGACDKGRALDWLVKRYRHHHPNSTIVSAALGDSENDVAMLEASDYAVIIRSPAHACPQLANTPNQNIYITHNRGPHGWVEGLGHVLKQLNISLD